MWELLTLPFVLLALAMALVLAGIHTYLGFHVVGRGVIFVDLCLAQAAAFGAVVAIRLGIGEAGFFHYQILLGFALLGALLVTLMRTRDERVPQDAFIGVLYAAFTVGTILFLSGQAEGAEELNHVLSGSLLTVTPGDLLRTSLLYAGVGAIHFFSRRQLFAITADRRGAEAAGLHTRRWDLLFYASFALVVTSSVQVAGVMLVFSLLVIPPVIAVLFAEGRGACLATGWVLGLLAALLGVLASLRFDQPVGPAISAVLVCTLVASGALLWLRSRMRGST
jgi:zinc/manganese transport system permease protein